jgi:hypothetical protein
MKISILLAIASPLGGAVLPAGAASPALTPAGDLRITKSEITGTVTFHPFKAGKVLLEVLAVRAPDGAVRIALNTCQVCWSSGRGWYTQQGDVVVCNNCGNRFPLSRIGIEKGGCNPVPVPAGARTDDAKSIVISKAFLAEAAPLFTKWKR